MALLAALTSATLLGCAAPTTPASGTQPSTAPTTSPRPPSPDRSATPEPAVGTRFEESTIRLIRRYFETRGAQYLGTDTSANGGQRLVFVATTSLARSGSTSRARQLEVYAAPRDGTSTVLARAFWLQFDCDQRTAQILNGEEYADQLATQRVSRTAAVALNLSVPAKSSREAIMNRACASQRPIPGNTPGMAPRAGSGSGVVIAPTTVLSNHHVASNCASIDVLLTGQRYPARLRKSDSTVDLALLEVPGLPSTSTPALRARASIGEPVMVAGYPLQGVLASDLIVTDGIINSLSGLAHNATQLQISAPVQPGNSGGPLLDRSGHLVGIVVAKLDALRTMVLTGDIPQNINFAVRPELVAKFLAGENLVVATGEPDVRLDTQELASRANAYTVKVECRAQPRS